jgi:hypothetical protein
MCQQADGGGFRCAPTLDCCFIDNDKELDYCFAAGQTPCVSEAGSRVVALACDDGADCAQGSSCCMPWDGGAMNASTCKSACSSGDVVLCASNAECPAGTCTQIGITYYRGCL